MQTGQAFRCRSLAHGPALCAWRSRTRVAAQAASSNKFVWVEPLSKVVAKGLGRGGQEGLELTSSFHGPGCLIVLASSVRLISASACTQ